MFPSPNCFNPLDHQPSLKRSSSSYLDHENPSSKESDEPPFLFNFPCQYFDDHELPLNQQILSSMQNHNLIMHHPPNLNHTTDNTTTTNKGNNGKAQAIIPPAIRRSRNLGAIPRRRTGKKDRHSKICTAQGIRDRRMRLSLQVARKFFDLQDMLGYDKASQTIEWLFNQSNKAIKDLAQQQLPDEANYNNTMMMMISTTSTTADAKSTESFLSSECEVVSQISNINNDIVVPNNPKDDDEGRKLGGLIIKPSSCKMRESRDKARARARCRTREKMMIKRLQSSRVVQKLCKSNPSDDDDDNLEKLRSSNLMSSPFGGVDDGESSVNTLINGISTSSKHHQVADDVGTIEKLLGHYSTSSSTIFDYSALNTPTYNAVDPLLMGYLAGNNHWELLNNFDDHRPNSINYGVTNAGNPNSIYSPAPKFP